MTQSGEETTKKDVSDILEPLQRLRPKEYLRLLKESNQTLKKIQGLQDNYTSLFNQLISLEKRSHELAANWKSGEN